MLGYAKCIGICIMYVFIIYIYIYMPIYYSQVSHTPFARSRLKPGIAQGGRPRNPIPTHNPNRISVLSKVNKMLFTY